MKVFAALLSGSLFGLGLALAGMTDPAKVIGFLDISGRWNPALAFVMGAALLVTTPAYWLAQRSHARPLADTRFHLPSYTAIDRRLIGGSLLFGVGWGIAGLCPGPAIANLGTAQLPMLLFVLCMAGGMWLHDMLDNMQARLPNLRSAKLPNP